MILLRTLTFTVFTSALINHALALIRFRSMQVVQEPETGIQSSPDVMFLCKRIFNRTEGECPSVTLGCPSVILCNDGDGSLTTLCQKVANVGCGVNQEICLTVLANECGCPSETVCAGQNNPGDGNSSTLCQGLASTKQELCQTQTGLCPAGLICKTGGTIQGLCEYCNVSNINLCTSSLQACGCQQKFEC